MRRIKKGVSPVKIIALVIVGLLLINVAARYIVSEVNYANNLEFDEKMVEIYDNSNYIQDLEKDGMENFKYSLNNNLAQTSAWASIYNVLNAARLNGLLSGDEILPSSIIKSLDLYGSLFFGYAGTLPNSVKWYLNSVDFIQECEVKITYERSEFVPNLREAVAGIEFETDFKESSFRAINILPGEDSFEWMTPKVNFNENLLLGANTETYKEDKFIALITLHIKE